MAHFEKIRPFQTHCASDQDHPGTWKHGKTQIQEAWKKKIPTMGESNKANASTSSPAMETHQVSSFTYTHFSVGEHEQEHPPPPS